MIKYRDNLYKNLLLKQHVKKEKGRWKDHSKFLYKDLTTDGISNIIIRTPTVESERLRSHFLAEYFFGPQCFHLHDGEYDGIYLLGVCQG